MKYKQSLFADKSTKSFLSTCPLKLLTVFSEMKIKLTNEQEARLNELIEQTILPALQEDICIPDMSDIEDSSPIYDEVFCERVESLMNQAVLYLKENIN